MKRFLTFAVKPTEKHRRRQAGVLITFPGSQKIVDSSSIWPHVLGVAETFESLRKTVFVRAASGSLYVFQRHAVFGKVFTSCFLSSGNFEGGEKEKGGNATRQ